ncbi:hypothetical protein [Streptomyces griseomycini]|uniref:Uncharacterized protein n=1 Tax=Streptomyces griseomycini TaxID=66895 RepID=A0A7W7V9Z2_9ACTN|nr:hypothetical protein [Streptomyces griseomycini]MBB4902578.1 hypothetical protein [Streptomyces griseomycini]GGR54279.1 hypothetical protein GCM10015536_69490 [Streptomyces griseomycini]
MLTPATPELLAELDALLRPGTAPLSSLAGAVDAAEVHAETLRGGHTTEAFGRYCRVALPSLLRRLLAAESEVLTLRAALAEHVAAADQGDDPEPGELLEDLKRRGVDLRADVEAAAAVLEGQAHAAAIG